jgi:hypothetical protein
MHKINSSHAADDALRYILNVLVFSVQISDWESEVTDVLARHGFSPDAIQLAIFRYLPCSISAPFQAWFNLLED